MLNKALALIARYPDLADFLGPRTDQTLSAAERTLSLEFAPSYRSFLAALGAGRFGNDEFLGVIDDDFVNSMHPDGIWLTLRMRREGLPDHWIVVLYDEDASYYFLDTSTTTDESGEQAVVSWTPGTALDAPIVVARSFGEFFCDRIEQQLADNAA